MSRSESHGHSKQLDKACICVQMQDMMAELSLKFRIPHSLRLDLDQFLPPATQEVMFQCPQYNHCLSDNTYTRQYIYGILYTLKVQV